MKIIITSKNFHASDHLKEIIEKKLSKLDKYFSNDIVANVMLSSERDRHKVEATINAKGMIFRAEDTGTDAYDGIDRVVDKLSSQMSRFKSKLQNKYKDTKEVTFGNLPEDSDEFEEIRIVRKKKFDLVPMTVDEAVVQMELLHHNFYVFLNLETDTVSVVYKRTDKDYGLLETSY